MAAAAATIRDTAAVLLALAIATLALPLFALLACILPWASRSCFSLLWFQCDDHFDWSSDFQLPAAGLPPAEKLWAPAYRGGRVVRHDTSREGQVDCCFCLCRVEDGDEVRELRCAHVFHRACLDRWVDVGRASCPLCRRWLGPADVARERELSAFSGLQIGWLPS